MKTKLELSEFFGEVYELDKDGIPNFKIFSGGKWYFPKGGKLIDVKSPIDGALVARISQAEEKDADRVVSDADGGRFGIRRIPAIKRLNIMEKASSLLESYRDEVIDSIVLSGGKTVADAEGEVDATMHRLSLTSEEARKIFGDYIPGDWAEENVGKYAMVIREPVGVVLAISPFNYPLFITFTKAIPALLAGNSVIVKPPSVDALPAILMTRLLDAAEMPTGALSMVTGRGSIGSYIAKSPAVDMVTFTGSTSVGKELTTTSGIKKIHLELGGKGSAIVLDDVDAGEVAEKVLAGSLKNAGQRCDAISRVLVQGKVYRRFIAALKAGIKSWKCGDPRERSTKVGPLISAASAERVSSLIKDARLKGAKLEYGGGAKGAFVEPTLLSGVPLEARIMWEETFGPVVAVHMFKEIDEAIEISNKSEYGLDSCVFTENINHAWKVAKRLEVGEVTINNFPAHGVGVFPFGGVKESGLGREGIGYSIEEFTNTKTIVVDTKAAKTWANAI